jgi:hypothetical protein
MKLEDVCMCFWWRRTYPITNTKPAITNDAVRMRVPC